MPSATPHPSTNTTYPLAILDVGASSLRITLQPSPTSSPHTHTVPNCILRTRAPDRKVHIGSDITSKCTDYSCATIRSPIERGFITDWMAQKTLWDVELPRALAGLSSGSGVVAGEALLSGWNVVITEAYFNLTELETGIETLFLEEYGASAIWRTTSAQLASFAPMTTSSGATAKGKDTAGNETESSEAQTDQEVPSTTQDVKAPRPPARSKRTSTGGAQPAAATTSSRTGTSHVRRPEACLMVDLGHSYTHVVPLLYGSVIWSAVRRLDIGGKLMTNLLKEAISFTQWDVMEESWIIDQLKRSAFFVAASSLEPDKTQPSAWDVAALARLKRHVGTVKRKGVRVDPIEQEFVLPDYTDQSVARDPTKRYGWLRSGPGVQSSGTAQSKRKKVITTTAEMVPESERDMDDAFIADPVLARSAHTAQGDVQMGMLTGNEEADDDDDDDEDAGEDYHDSGSDSDSSQRASVPKLPAKAAPQKRKQPSTATLGDEEDEQAVKLSAERWQIPELLFHPEQIGLDALGLSDLIYASINAASDDPAVRGLMYSNICLFGGIATLPGLRRRLELDVKSLADEDYCVRVRTCPEPSMAAINGALHLPQRVFQAHFVRRDEWQKAGNAATALARGRFGCWGAAPAVT